MAHRRQNGHLAPRTGVGYILRREFFASPGLDKLFCLKYCCTGGFLWYNPPSVSLQVSNGENA